MADAFKKYPNLVPKNEARALFDKIIQGVGVYLRCLFFWHDLASSLPGKVNSDKWKEFASTRLNDYNKIIENCFAVFFPKQMQEWFKEAASQVEVCQQVFFNFFRPWLDSSEDLQSNFLKALKGDQEAYLEFLRKWNQAFLDSYGKQNEAVPLPAGG